MYTNRVCRSSPCARGRIRWGAHRPGSGDLLEAAWVKGSFYARLANRRFRIAWYKSLELVDVEAGPFIARNDRCLSAPPVADFGSGSDGLSTARSGEYRIAEVARSEAHRLRVHAGVGIGGSVEALERAGSLGG